MTTLQIRTTASSLVLALAACSSGGGNSSLPSARSNAGYASSFASRTAKTSSYRVLHAFNDAGDGNYANAGLILVKGLLYGTTIGGGNYGNGTIFSVDPTTGDENIVYSFGRGRDAAVPYAHLLLVNDLLYGTTYSGGSAKVGTVFVFDPRTNKERVLYSFHGADGFNPMCALVEKDGVLYGTASSGGAYSKPQLPEGVVFSLTMAGKEKVLHSFGSGTDGWGPYSGLLLVGDALYGTTTAGGQYNEGTLYRIARSGGTETILHDFGSSGDGMVPRAAPLYVGGRFYGTTSGGGSYGGGTLFAMSPTGKESVLHSFPGATYASGPWGSVISVNGVLYGTTYGGGGGPHGGSGTLFKFSPKGGLHVLHAFGTGKNGANPASELLYVGGLLYGTAFDGGDDNLGVVFSMKPSGS